MPKDLQSRFFEEILSRYNKKVEAIDALSKLLAVGRDAIYRRLRGDTVMLPEEMGLLAREYNISIDAFIYDTTDTIFFTYKPFAKKVMRFEDYLQSIFDDLERIHQLPNTWIDYASSEIPIFSYTFFPELFLFKLYTWGRTAWNFEYLNDRPFDFSIIPPSAMDYADRFSKLYMQLPSTELWSLNIADNTLNQIEYYFNSGSFAKEEDALLLCDKMIALIQHIKLMAAKGCKLPVDSKQEEGGAAFDLYHNEMVYTNNTILVKTTLGNAVYTSFGNPNFLKNTDERVYVFMEDWFNKIKAKSHPISKDAEKTRDWYFSCLRRKAEQTRNRIQMEMENQENRPLRE